MKVTARIDIRLWQAARWTPRHDKRVVITAHSGVRFCTFYEIADDFAARPADGTG